MGVGGQSHAPAAFYPPRNTRYPFYGRLGRPQGRSERAENLAHTGIRSSDRPARSQSLYRLSYRAHFIYIVQIITDKRGNTNTQCEVSFFLGKSPASVYYCMPTFRNSLSVPSSKAMVEQCSTIALEDGTDTEFRNVGIK